MEDYKIENINMQREEKPDTKVELKDDDVTMYPRPKKSCTKCFSRGYEGWNTSGEPVLCRCITNRFGNKSVTSFLTWGELVKIMSNRLEKEDESKESKDATVETIEATDKGCGTVSTEESCN
jgi:hypothetical protein